MKYALSSQCKKQLQKIEQKNEALYKKIKRKLKLFSQDPHHKSLRLHKLSGSQAETWSVSIDMSLRMLFVYREVQSSKTDKQVVFFVIGTHDEVYK
jgi:addiction module RelE/StbE family toxin